MFENANRPVKKVLSSMAPQVRNRWNMISIVQGRMPLVIGQPFRWALTIICLVIITRQAQDMDGASDRVMKVGIFHSSSMDETFSASGELGGVTLIKHIGFAERQFYLLLQSGSVDYISGVRGAEPFEARVGADVDGDEIAEVWTDWQDVAESYAEMVLRVVDVQPAAVDCSTQRPLPTFSK